MAACGERAFSNNLDACMIGALVQPSSMAGRMAATPVELLQKSYLSLLPYPAHYQVILDLLLRSNHNKHNFKIRNK